MLYPLLTKTRNLVDLSGIWNFCTEEADVNPANPLPNPISMAIPGSFNDQVTDAKLRDYVGYLWYERNFIIPESLLDQRIVLRFGSVTHAAEVYFNGELIKKHIGGFTPFEVELSKELIQDENNLKIRVSNIIDNTTLPNGVLLDNDDGSKKIVPNFDFYNYSGIHRPVILYTTTQTHIEDILVKYVFDAKTEQTVVTPELKVTGDYDKVHFEIKDETGQVVAESDSEELTIEDTHLWQPLNAYLYQLHVSVYQGETLLDSYAEEFGIRTLKIENNKFYINDKPFYFKGFGKHEDFPVIGRGMNQAVINLDFNLMKWTNANSMRAAHYPYSEEFLRMADREGFVVIDETSGVGLFNKFSFDVTQNKDDYDNTWEYVESQENHLNELRELITRDKNHPSIVAWAVGNEPASHQEGARAYFEPLIKLAKELDWEKRAVVIPNIINASAEKDEVADLLDIISLNRYYGWYIDHADLESAQKGFEAELEKWHELYPDKPILISEFGADTINGFSSVYATPFTEEYQVEYLKANFSVMDKKDYVIGEHVWNFADFETHPSVRRVDGNKKGVFTRDRRPKMSAHYLKNRWKNID